MRAQPRRPVRLPAIVAGLVLAAAVLVLGFTLVARARGGGATADIGLRSAAASTTSAFRALDPSAGAESSGTDATAAPAVRTRVLPTVTPLAQRKLKPRVVVPTGPSVAAYKGLGSWVDIYDDRAWNDPAGAVRDMAAHGVRTLFVETGNSRSSFALKDSAALQAFIRETHARHMLVVAWYLPDLQDNTMDYDRIAQAIRLSTPDGQQFDSFALDIESTVVGDAGARDAALTALSGKLRALVGRRYPLGAIIPSPLAISTKPGYWPGFPYAMLAKTYDAFVPMSYYTYHGSGGPAALTDTLSNVNILRAQPGCAKVPIHLIGGIAENSSSSEVRAFVQAGQQTKVYGASLYGWAGTRPEHWEQLKAVR